MANWRVYLKSSLLIPVVILLMSAYVLGKAYTYPVTAGKFPVFIASIMVILCLWEIILKGIDLRKLHSGADQIIDESSVKKEPIKVKTLVLTTGMFVYLLATNWIGFHIATFLFIILASRYLGLRKWWLSILISAVTVGFLYFVFGLLFGITFPAGILFE